MTLEGNDWKAFSEPAPTYRMRDISWASHRLEPVDPKIFIELNPASLLDPVCLQDNLPDTALQLAQAPDIFELQLYLLRSTISTCNDRDTRNHR